MFAILERKKDGLFERKEEVVLNLLATQGPDLLIYPMMSFQEEK